MKKDLPAWVKVGLSIFVAILVPNVWHYYGPTDLLWLCHVCLILALAAAWRESALLASMAAVGVLIIQFLWLGGLLLGLAGIGVSQPLQYMFDSQIPMHIRGLSLVHAWLPFLLLFMIKRLGYDRRALTFFPPLAWTVFLLSYLIAPHPPAPPTRPHLAVNINFVHGLSSESPQSWMAPGWWLLIIMAGASLALFLPGHLVLSRLFRPARPIKKAP